METTIMLGRLLALLYLAIGIGLLLNRAHYEKLYHSFFDSPASLYLGGMIALLLGFLIVSIHNEWKPGWPLLITVFGWVVMIKGIFVLAAPRAMLALSRRLLGIRGFMIWEGLFAIGLGLAMGYVGFVLY